ncbi:MAG: glycosyltransferase family 2 protein [Tannerellaceae bacterium]|nr:glycosyltransferase family 2 protein [Tannerellaceae bacterium]
MDIYKNAFPDASLIISTYNRPDALNLCLQSVINQTVLPVEIIIGDDGSTAETAELVERFRLISPVEIVHVWQEDRGFRLARSRNRCVAVSRGDYIIQIDGDLILHRHFIEDHLRIARRGCFLRGKRMRLSPGRTDELCAMGRLPRFHLFSRGLKRRINVFHSFALSRFLSTRYKRHHALASARGCNTSFWRSDFMRINGYDERYEGWGAEDTDLALRLMNSGLRCLILKFAGTVFHLWHEERYDEPRTVRNYAYYHGRVAEKAVRCEFGVEQHLQSADGGSAAGRARGEEGDDRAEACGASVN